MRSSGGRCYPSALSGLSSLRGWGVRERHDPARKLFHPTCFRVVVVPFSKNRLQAPTRIGHTMRMTSSTRPRRIQSRTSVPLPVMWKSPLPVALSFSMSASPMMLVFCHSADRKLSETTNFLTVLLSVARVAADEFHCARP
jgi:hypothetical protein